MYEKINPQKDFSVSECVWCNHNNDSCFGLIWEHTKTKRKRKRSKKQQEVKEVEQVLIADN